VTPLTASTSTGALVVDDFFCLSDGHERARKGMPNGHGFGKTALVCWIVLCAMTTAGDTRGIVTASTESMLTTRAFWQNRYPRSVSRSHYSSEEHT